MTLMMTSAQVVETSVNVTNNSPSRDYSHPDDQTTQTTETPGFKPFTVFFFPIPNSPFPILILYFQFSIRVSRSLFLDPRYSEGAVTPYYFPCNGVARQVARKIAQCDGALSVA